MKEARFKALEVATLVRQRGMEKGGSELFRVVLIDIPTTIRDEAGGGGEISCQYQGPGDDSYSINILQRAISDSYPIVCTSITY